MIILWIFLGIVIFLALLLISMGVYELITENRQDMAALNRTGQQLHLKHLEHINSGK